VDEARYDRQELLFGRPGQERIEKLKVGIVGLGGLGSHVAQQLSYLGVRRYVLVDGDRVTVSSLNRLVGAGEDDHVRALWKVEVAKRLIRFVRPGAEVEALPQWLDADASRRLEQTDVVFGCVDDDLPRLRLTELGARSQVPYIDLASDTGYSDGGPWYGGRVVIALDGRGCLSCLGLLDQRAMARSAMTPEQRAEDDRLYGVRGSALAEGGPSVVSVNGVVASLSVTEFMAWATGLRPPLRHLVYRGDLGYVRINADEPAEDCYYCKVLWRRTTSPARR
jgi:molybdopterin/thiamine biosynthesis adenylyltransferase